MKTLVVLGVGLTIALGGVASVCAGGATPPNSPWNLKSLHREVRSRIHLRVSDVPAFPHQEPAMRDPHRWPREMIVEGVRCELKVEAGQGDVTGIAKASVDEVGPNQLLILSYRQVGSAGREKLGPEYIWSASRDLVERFWIEPDSHYWISADYVYYPSGELHQYATLKTCKGYARYPGTDHESFIEYFDRSGRLKAVWYSHIAPDGVKTNACYRYGARIDWLDFEPKERQSLE